MKNNKEFLTGAEIVVKALQDVGAEMMYGYPITPATEILTGWIKKGNKYLQTEDEISAGFGVCGAVMAGQKAFTASSGPGNILMQDSLSMAEGMRLPFVMIVAQRGGPSSGTVIYSQQEVVLSCYGGNGEGMRIVYSPSNLFELYSHTTNSFKNAWKYRFPSIVLTDGYMLKTKGVIEFLEKKSNNISSYPLVSEDKIINWPNIYTMEKELFDEIEKSKKDFQTMSDSVSEFEFYGDDNPEILVIAHGIVGAVTKEAVKELNKQNKKVALFRPITLRPFAKKELDKIVAKKELKKILFVESSNGQLARVVKDQLDTKNSIITEELFKPALGIEKEEIITKILEIKSL